MVAPRSHWETLDVATGAGHCAFVFAPHVAHVVATDVTSEMLELAASLGRSRALDNVTFKEADAHSLPFADETFDLVTCRIAPHHFADPDLFVTQCVRVLTPGGLLAVVDNVAPVDPATAKWCDEFERARDASHQRCLSVEQWHDLFIRAGLRIVASETMRKHMNFGQWADNMSVSAQVSRQLIADLSTAPKAAVDWLCPAHLNDTKRASFVLTEGLFVAQKNDQDNETTS